MALKCKRCQLEIPFHNRAEMTAQRHTSCLVLDLEDHRKRIIELTAEKDRYLTEMQRMRIELQGRRDGDALLMGAQQRAERAVEQDQAQVPQWARNGPPNADTSYPPASTAMRSGRASAAQEALARRRDSAVREIDFGSVTPDQWAMRSRVMATRVRSLTEQQVIAVEQLAGLRRSAPKPAPKPAPIPAPEAKKEEPKADRFSLIELE